MRTVCLLTTICVLEGLLAYERAGRKSVAVTKARKKGENYLLERRMFRSLRTGEVIEHKDRLKLKNRETGRIGSQCQTVISAYEIPPRRALFAPNQGGRKLQTVSRTQGVFVQGLLCQITDPVIGKNFPPTALQQCETCDGSLFVEV